MSTPRSAARLNVAAAHARSRRYWKTTSSRPKAPLQAESRTKRSAVKSSSGGNRRFSTARDDDKLDSHLPPEARLAFQASTGSKEEIDCPTARVIEIRRLALTSQLDASATRNPSARVYRRSISRKLVELLPAVAGDFAPRGSTRKRSYQSRLHLCAPTARAQAALCRWAEGSRHPSLPGAQQRPFGRRARNSARRPT